jgi:coenzyme PQQ synthesis protein D (PqqD)
MPKMTEQLHLRATPGLGWRRVEDQVIALDVTGSLYLAVNQSGTILWEALVRGATRGALVQALINAYALAREAAEHDTDAFLTELGRRGLLDPHPPRLGPGA